MARYCEPTAKQKRGWTKWVNELPPMVQEIARRFDPWSLYRMKSTDHRVTLHSISEDGTVTVNVLAEFNLVTHERQVFGIDPNDLEPCDLPSADEPVGAMLTQHEVEDNIDALRVLIRPDLWILDSNGKAVRKQ